jgi:C4-dicarboxylate transporter DctM subunit
VGAIATMLISFLVIGMPIGIALAGAAVLFILFDPMLSPGSVFKAFFNFQRSYTLMAIPFFILAGFLMERTGLIKKLFEFADAVIGWVPGGFAYATQMSAVMFGAISGSSTAMSAAMGVIAFPEMKKRGYPEWMSAGVLACGGGIAILIPPSITLILYGILTEESIVALFFAGIIPGLMLAFSDATIIICVSIFFKLPRGHFTVKRLVSSFFSSLPALMMPVLVLGGLYGGIFTPTEAGAASCGYAIVYGIIVQRGEFFKDLLPVCYRAANLTAVVFFLVGCVGVFQFLLANKGWPQDIAFWVNNLGLGTGEFLALLAIVLLAMSMFLTGIAILVLTVPIIFPVAVSMGIDPIHLGIIIALAVEMGAVIPPVGLNLFAVSGTTGVPVHRVMRGTFPFLCTDSLVLIAVIMFPIIPLWIPNMMAKNIFN